MLKRFYNTLTWDVKSMPVLAIAIIITGLLTGCGESPEEAAIRLEEKRIEAQVEIAKINAEAQMEIADDYSEAGMDQNGNYNQGGNMGGSAPVIVNNSDSGMGDLATGMILGSMLSGDSGSSRHYDDYDRSQPKTVVNKTVVNKTVIVNKDQKPADKKANKQTPPPKKEVKKTNLNFSKSENTKQVNKPKTPVKQKKKVKKFKWVTKKVPYQQCTTKKVNGKKKRVCTTKYKTKKVKETYYVYQ